MAISNATAVDSYINSTASDEEDEHFRNATSLLKKNEKGHKKQSRQTDNLVLVIMLPLVSRQALLLFILLF